MIGPRIGARIGPMVGARIGSGTDELAPQGSRKLIVIAGQSNAFGQQATGNITNPLRTGIGGSYGNVHFRQKSSQPTAADPIVWTTDTTGTLSSYTSSSNNLSGHGIDGTGLGVAQSIGRHLDYYKGNNFDIIVVGVSGSDLANHWNPSGTFPSGGTNLWQQAVAVAVAAAGNFGAEIAAFGWVQGETDAADSTKASNYGTNLTALFAAVRAQWPNIPIIFSQLPSSNTATFTSTVRSAQASVAGATSNCTMITTDDLTLTDGTHYNADSYVALGDRFGYAIVNALGLSSPVSWTIDPYSLIGCPANQAEVAALFNAAGVSGITAGAIYLMQDASGNLADAGPNGLTMTAAGTGITYQATNIGWNRKFIQLAEGSTGVFSTTSATLPDPSTTSQARIMIAYLGQSASAKSLYLWGTSGFSAISRSSTSPGTFHQVSDGANVASNTTTAVTAQVRPFVEIRNKTTPGVAAYTDVTSLSTTIGTVTGKKNTIGTGTNPLLAVAYVLDLFGSNAELTTAQVRSVLQTMGIGRTSTGGTALPW